MPSLSQVLAPDNYDGKTAVIQNQFGAHGGWFNISGKDAFMQMQFSRSNQQGEEDWTQEIHLGAGAFAILPANCIGVQFRNATPGSPATITAQIAVGDEPALSISALGSIATTGRTPTRTIITSLVAGNYSPPAGCVGILIEGLGGGGTGGQAQTGSNATWAVGSGGNGGWYAAKFIAAPVGPYAYQVGAGGAAIAGGGTLSSNRGANTTFGGVLIAEGGNGGSPDGQAGHTGYWTVNPQGPIGGSVGDLIIAGQMGGIGIGLASGALLISGRGGMGAGPLGGPGAVEASTAGGSGTGNGLQSDAWGAGSSGSIAGNFSGGAIGVSAGGQGILVITEFY